MGGGGKHPGHDNPYYGMNALQSVQDRQQDTIAFVRSALASESSSKQKARDKVFEFQNFMTTDFKTFVMNERKYTEQQYITDSQHYLLPDALSP